MIAAAAAAEASQSALAPRGREAAEVARLFWVMVAGGAAIALLVAVAAAAAAIGPASWRRALARGRFVIAAGIAFPIVTLTALLAYGVWLMRAAPADGAAGESLVIAVEGERWWWRVRYRGPDGEIFETANELRIPVGRPVAIELTTADVIHSFWAPALAGKADMIPGRTNVLHLEATEPGLSRGQCAEYCGGAHALMAFNIVALPEEEFAAWLAHAASDAAPPRTPLAQRGFELFLSAGCSGCHAVRGTPARGVIGPDLTHVGNRRSLAAGVLPNHRDAFARWIRDNQRLKPENLMLPYDFLPEEDVAALAAYLEGLK